MKNGAVALCCFVARHFKGHQHNLCQSDIGTGVTGWAFLSVLKGFKWNKQTQKDK